MRPFFAALALLLPLAACTGQSLDPVQNRAEGFAPWTETAPEYRIGPGDKVRVQYLLTPEMNEVALVAPDGQTVLRTTGRLSLAGQTLAEAEKTVGEASRRVLLNPIVTVGLEEAGSSVVLVGGAVARQGPVPLAGPKGVLEAILLAGGFEADARMGQVVLIRRGPGDRPMLRTVDVRGYIQAPARDQDVPLRPGDVVYVPRSGIGEVNLWIDQFVNRLVPFNRSFSYTFNKNTATGAF